MAPFGIRGRNSSSAFFVGSYKSKSSEGIEADDLARVVDRFVDIRQLCPGEESGAVVDAAFDDDAGDRQDLLEQLFLGHKARQCAFGREAWEVFQLVEDRQAGLLKRGFGQAVGGFVLAAVPAGDGAIGQGGGDGHGFSVMAVLVHGEALHGRAAAEAFAAGGWQYFAGALYWQVDQLAALGTDLQSLGLADRGPAVTEIVTADVR